MPDRFERLANLLALLLDTQRPVSLEDIVERIPGYPSEKASYRRQFERDKDTLRALGVPIRVEQDAFGDDVGYRVDRREYELPDLGLEPDERAALHTAVSAVHLEGSEGREALWKLGGLGGDARGAPMGALPTVPWLPALVEACRQRAPVTFGYRDDERRVDPYVVLFRGGNWYLVGYDHDRGEVRSFRADRIGDEVAVGEADAFDRPPDFDAEAVLHDEPWRYGDDEPVEARVRVDATVAPWVVQRLGAGAVDEADEGDGVVVRLTVTNPEAFRSFVLGLLDHAEVLAPDALRDDTVAWLRALAGGSGS